MRLGDLDALFYKLVNTDPNTPLRFCDGVAKAMEFILNEPTIDAVPVVRCKDCKHMTLEMGYLYCCDVWQGINGSGADGYCSYGERKDGEG